MALTSFFRELLAPIPSAISLHRFVKQISALQLAETRRSVRLLGSPIGAVFSFALALCLSPVSHAQNRQYAIVDLGPGILPQGVNNSGQVVAQTSNGATVLITPGSGLINVGTLGGTLVFGAGINNHGQVAGFSGLGVTPPIVVNSFVYTPGQGMVDITPGFSDAEAHAINDSGQVIFVAPSSAFPAFNSVSYLYTPGQSLALLGSFFARAINNAGATTGQAGFGATGSLCDGVTTPCIYLHAYLSSPGVGPASPVLDLGPIPVVPPPFGFSVGFAVSNSGFVTGFFDVGGTGPPHAFLYEPTTGMVDIGTLGGTPQDQSEGVGVNTLGDVVGFSSLSVGQHAFLYTSLTGITDLNTFVPAGTGWIFTSAAGISDTGFIAGNGTLNGLAHGFLLVPGNCGDVRDTLIQEYAKPNYGYNVTFYPGATPSTPHCTDFTHNATGRAQTAFYSFNQLNTSIDPSTGQPYSWAIIRSSLVAPASAGYGLDAWVNHIPDFQGPRPLNSVYRNPDHNFKPVAQGGAGSTSPNSRHMFGDAADMRNLAGTACGGSAASPLTCPLGVLEYLKLYYAAWRAHASWIEPLPVTSGGCGLGCVHAQWVSQQPGTYINP